MKNTNCMTMNTNSAFATTNAGFSCAQMPCTGTEAEYVMLCVGAIVMVSTFVLPIIRLAAVPVLLLALRLWVVNKTK